MEIPMGSQSVAISISHLSKYFEVPEREAGAKAALGSLFKRHYKVVKAVDDISATLSKGEMVGFLGPNGAGKTTTLKMLSGLLHPTSGQASVLGYQPFRREREYLRQITMVMGQRNQLQWDIPAADSYDLQRAIYQVPAGQFRQTLAEFVDLLDLGPIIKKPVRNLSLGERMKVEIAGSLLHRPSVLFLDEPTIGLDVAMQRRIRAFIAEYNQRNGATVLLTSHYMADIVALCQRVIVIHHGQILYDGDLIGLAKRFNTHKKITLRLTEDCADLSSYGEVLSNNLGVATLRVPIPEVSRSTAKLLAEISVSDLTIEDPPIEDAIVQVFSDLDSA
jgi:ABC-2 type transport system ATP-binding protein